MDNENLTSAEAEQLGENVNLRQYWRVILERRWLVLATFVSVFVLALVYLGKAPRIFQAVTRLEINQENEDVLGLRDGLAMSMNTREQDYLQTQYKKLVSRSLIESVMEKLNLATDPRYAPVRDKPLAVADDIAIAPIRLSRLVDIKVEHTDPKQAAAIANALVNQFIEKNLDQKRYSYQQMGFWLTQEVASQRSQVADADQALQKYKEQFNNVSLEETQNIVLQALKAAQEELVRAQTRTNITQKLDSEIQRLLVSGTPIENLPQVANDRYIQELKGKVALLEAELANQLKRYRTNYSSVVELQAQVGSLLKSIREGATNIVNSIQIEAQIAKAQEESLGQSLDQSKKEMLKLGQLQIEYDRLKRDAELKKGLEVKLLDRKQQNEAAANSKINNMRVVDAAVVPYQPIKPRILLTLVLGVFGGLAAGCGLAFFVNYLDDSIKTQDDVELYLRLPFLGYVANIKSNSVIERDLQAHLHPQSTVAEGFRTLRAAISLMPNSDKYCVKAVTSTIPSEGKSLVATNLAIVTAQAGARTLLVDGDLRRPSVHKSFQLHSPVGLSAYLQGTMTNFQDLLHHTEIPNLDVVCVGALPQTPSELIGSMRMRQFLDEARQAYDRIIVDCPPISAVSDPLVVGAMSDGIVFVTKFNKIRREHARKSIQRIQDAGIHILGVILNDIDFEGKDSYYYSYYYYQNRYYSSHYRTADGKPIPAKTAPGAGNPDGPQAAS